MPNFWTKTSQSLSESLNGPRTKDKEFDNKVEELKLIEKGVMGVRMIFQNFLNQTISLKNVYRDIHNSVKNAFERTSPFYETATDICTVHLEMEKIYTNFNENVYKLYSKTSEWGVLFEQAKKAVEHRDSLRKVHDHYDEKLEKIYKTKLEKQRKNSVESNKDINILKRVYFNINYRMKRNINKLQRII